MRDDHVAYIVPKYLKSNDKPYDDGMELEIDCRVNKCPNGVPNLCGKLAKNEICDNKICRYSHDIDDFIIKKPDVLPYECPSGTDCIFGIKCLLSHENNVKRSEPLSNLLPYQVQCKLRKRKYEFHLAKNYIQQAKLDKVTQENEMMNMSTEDMSNGDAPYIKPTNREELAYKRRRRNDLFKSDNTYLAPLTTHGHVAFRRLTKHFGADITCGEMALSTSILQGVNSYWLTFKRHVSEVNFGVQIAAKHVDVLAKTCEVIKNHTNVDFVDLNLCCPIESQYERGIGASLLPRLSQVEELAKAMSNILRYQKPSHLSMDNSIRDPEEHMPLLTVKMRTGVKDGKNVAHNLIPVFEKHHFDMASVHGRSREQRYSKLADWDYLNRCASKCDEMAFFGNGDVTDYEGYYRQMESEHINGILIGRGALIKPWIFEEIKERRHIDKSSTERMSIIKLFMEYGMEQFGTDLMGVRKTRRFFLEWWSFAHRYVPYTILEHAPHLINHRPQSWWGRNELETWLGSDNPSDWIRLSEIFLGPCESDFTFKPKHKSVSYK
eukprot:NODE_39_length_29903_cov_0.529057.p4 type:complete len:550 gc:universal NODE_39_length_29903_cov_0.529057:12841-14490(+)